jgi:NAD(P)-dependent dehydrogenase (short-subunit alcohol dehydrogenase family)
MTLWQMTQEVIAAGIAVDTEHYEADKIEQSLKAEGFEPTRGGRHGTPESLHLHGKLIEPAQVASLVAFLFTDGASAINGSTIPVEDGFQIFRNS